MRQGHEANPMFVDEDARNFRLRYGSPGLNTGMNQDWMIGALDLDGAPRVDGTFGVVDMGCYEYTYYGTSITIR